MKKLMTVVLLAIPAGAQAAWMHSGMREGMRFGPPAAGLHFAVALYALLAALGYWVLQHAAKETAASVRRAGKTVAWLLLVTGVCGLLCGVAAHVKRNSCCHKCAVQAAGGQEEQELQAGGGGKAEWHEAKEAGAAGGPAQQTIKVQVKTEKPAPVKK